MFSKRKIKITNVCKWSLVFIGLFIALFTAATLLSHANFRKLQAATDEYILCQQAALELEDGSNYPTEQIRLYAITGESTYRDAYLEELYVTQRREHALETLKETFGDADAVGELESALAHSQYLTATELYAMRLTAEAVEPDQSNWPEILREIELSVQDQRLSADGKQQRAQSLVTSDDYQHTRDRILAGVTGCMAELSTQTYNIQNRAYQIFRDVYLKLEIATVILLVCMGILCIILRKIIIHPLSEYLQSVKEGKSFPLTGAAELQELAVTYNEMFLKNEETQKRIHHQANHDALTDVLNRSAFDQMLHLFEDRGDSFALILVDVDHFKAVNDTYGHAVGDQILKKVAAVLTQSFRSVDYVFRIGGDEFAVIMVEMTSDLGYTILNKIEAANETLSHPADGLPPVTLSVGAAFIDRPNPEKSLFQDADTALYYVKEHGRRNCRIF